MRRKGCPTQGLVAESGAEKTIAYLRLPSGAEPARKFIDSLPIRDRAKIFALLRRMADHGIVNPYQFSQVEPRSQIFAFKANALRILCFHDVDHLILLIGGTRINGKIPRPVVDRAKRLWKAYRAAKIALIDRRAVG